MRTAEEILSGNMISPYDYFGRNLVGIINQARKEAIEECAEIADLKDGCYDDGCHCNEEGKKKSILSLLLEIK